jgi:hypothetical protein
VHPQMPQQTRDVADRQQALCRLKILSHTNTLAKRLRPQPTICLPEPRDHGFKVSAAWPADRHDHEPCQETSAVPAGALPNCIPARPQH